MIPWKLVVPNLRKARNEMKVAAWLLLAELKCIIKTITSEKVTASIMRLSQMSNTNVD
jgi:hypothetical protein